MEKLLKFGMLSALFVGLLFSSFVVAAADGAAINDIGGASTGSDSADTDAAGTKAVNAGNVYHLDLDAESTTNYWAGVWGNVSGKVELRTSTNEIFLTESMTLPGPRQDGFDQGVRTLVFAWNVADTVPDFANLNVAPRTGANIDTVTGVDNSLTDAASNIYTENSLSRLIIGTKQMNSQVANAAWCARSHNATSGMLIFNDCALYTNMVLNDGSNNLLFMAEASNPYAGPTPWKIFNNLTFAHYQMLLFVNNSGNNNAQNYEFFLELR